ncbi:MAG: DUF1648 domain-containing protein [Chitinophagaceae bacterium]|nr:MAG: DUF1648 domain-containing protein [Chitinophagaceae bacterium]
MSNASRFLGMLAGGLLLFCWLMVIKSYGNLPATVPVHFNAQGQPDNWGPKAGIWILPILASAVFGLFTLLHKYADRFPRKGNAVNHEAGLLLVRALFLQLRFAVTLVMAVGIFYSLRAASGVAGAEPPAMAPFIILVMLAPILLFAFRILRVRRKAA